MNDPDSGNSPGRRLLPSEKLLALRHAFEASRIPYAFGGAIALFYYRDPRSTTDIDINVFLPPERQAEVLTVLGQLFAFDHLGIGSEIEENGQARALWGATFVDLFFADTDFHDAMARRVRREPFLDEEIPVLSAEDLLVCKALFDRPKDWLDIAAVVAAQGEALDGAYVDAALALFVEEGDHRFVRWRELTGGDASGSGR